jgi:uncharacterized OsmC-like protein
MSTEIRTALERNVKAVTLRPSVGQGTAVTRVRLRDGLACDVTEGPWSLTAGMTAKYGGTNEGPNPGVLGRAALGACLALGYGMWAARLGVPIATLDVEVHADYDVRGELGADTTVRPGYQAIRYIVSLTSPAPEADVRHMVETADRHSSWRDVIANPVPLTRELRISAPDTQDTSA